MLTDVMDDVAYADKNFNEIETLTKHPPWMTESHFVYHLQRAKDGELSFQRDTEGEPLCSPRPLNRLGMQHLVANPSRMKILMGKCVPADLYPALLTEAILQRSLQTVSHLVSTWPFAELHVRDMVPSEDLDRYQQLTEPLDASLSVGMSLCDALMAGLLNSKSSSKLQTVIFAGFKDDRKLCEELVRLPILWMKPADRHPEVVHSLLRPDMGISLDDVDRYVTKIGCIYASVDRYVRHGHSIGPITVVMDCRMSLDDVPIGLALQEQTPFRFRCQRVWLDCQSDMTVPLPVLKDVLDSRHISHLEIEVTDLCKNPNRWQELQQVLENLPSLHALSLPNCLHVDQLDGVFGNLSKLLSSLNNLRRLNLSFCNLKDSLRQVLQGLNQGLTYLALRDCRLTPQDLQALLEWTNVSELRELNLSRNNLQAAATQVVDLVRTKLREKLTCFSVSYCSLLPADLQHLAHTCQSCLNLKVLAVQSFIPPLPAEMQGILEACAEIPSLQRCVLFPEAYAFPGSQISQRTANRASVGLLCLDLLVDLGRPDIKLE